VLRNVIKTWETLDGTSETLEPPTTAQMPYLRISGGPSVMSQAEAAAWNLEFTLIVMIATPGLNQDDQTNLWGAFRAALNQAKPFNAVTVLEHVRSSGITMYGISSPGFGAYPPLSMTAPSRAQDLISVARVVLQMYILF
jgi:hypothetical protein